MRLIEGKTFGPYRLHEQLGSGGMAAVHRATLEVDGEYKELALKRILPHLRDDQRFLQFLAKEARLCMMLEHPNIVAVHKLGKIDDEYFLSMEYVRGRNLLEILRQARRQNKAPSAEVVLSILMAVCRALQYTHERCREDGRGLGLVHRDISPSNLVLSDAGEVKLIDFGVATTTSDRENPIEKQFRGKMAYVAPEILEGRAADARVDLWSTGVLAHELITLSPLFHAPTDGETLRKLRTLTVENPCLQNSRCPVSLGEIVLRALRRNPADRWQSAQSMCSALEELAIDLHIVPSKQAIAAWLDDLAFEHRTEEVSSLESMSVEYFQMQRSDTPLELRKPVRVFPLQAPPASLVKVVPAPAPRGRSSRMASEQDASAWPVGTRTPPPAPSSAAPSPWTQRPIAPTRRLQSGPSRRLLGLGLGTVLATALVLIAMIPDSSNEPGLARGEPAGGAETSTALAQRGLPTTLAVSARPEGARIFIDDRAQTFPLELAPGSHKLRVELDGYETYREELTISPAMAHRYQVILAPTRLPSPGIKLEPIVTPFGVTAISGSDMQKISGEGLVLSASMARQKRIRVILCVGYDGEVQSSYVLSQVSGAAEKEIRQQLSAWHYQPYRQAELPTNVCFTDALPVSQP